MKKAFQFSKRYLFQMLILSVLIFSQNPLYALSENEFSDALSYNDFDKVKQHLITRKNMIDLNRALKSGSCEGVAPLHCTDSTEIMQLLIDNGADINRTIGGRTALEAAAGNKDSGTSAMYLLEKGARPTGRALYEALWYENIELAERLIDSGADPNYYDKDGSGYSSLIIAAQNGYSLKLIKKLVNAGADVKFASKDEKFTALHFFPDKRSTQHQGFVGDLDDLNISTEETLEKIEFLISKGAEITPATKYGFTPLLMAAARNEEAALLLVSKGADINAISKTRETALQMAASAGFEKLVKYLVEHNANIHAKNREGWTAIFFAAQNGNYRVIKMLLDKGAKCSVYDRKKNSPLHLISIFPTAEKHYEYLRGHEKEFYMALELILKKSGTGMIHRRNLYGESPWFNLAGWMYPLPEKISIFLKYGAKKETRDLKTKKTLRQTLQKSYNSKKDILADFSRNSYIKSIEILK